MRPALSVGKVKDKERPMKRITIDPVTRIEGHAKIVIQLDDKERSPTPSFT